MKKTTFGWGGGIDNESQHMRAMVRAPAEQSWMQSSWVQK